MSKVSPRPAGPAVFTILVTLWLSACTIGSVVGPDDGSVILLSQPVDRARISRGFGMWRHPILGYWRMHRGVDYVVPRGTPVRATGDGVVEVAGWHKGYGRYIRIRHKNGIRTVYAHLSHIAESVREGSSVRMGTEIGLSGSSGLSTGPHLHYEVWRGDVAIDPSALHHERQFVLLRNQLSANE